MDCDVRIRRQDRVRKRNDRWQRAVGNDTSDTGHIRYWGATRVIHDHAGFGRRKHSGNTLSDEPVAGKQEDLS
jgi:hypothetical protein